MPAVVLGLRVVRMLVPLLFIVSFTAAQSTLSHDYNLPGQYTALKYEGGLAIAAIDGSIFVVNVTSDKKLWEKPLTGKVTSFLTANGNLIYSLWSKQSITSRSITTGKIIWEIAAPANIVVNPDIPEVLPMMANGVGAVLFFMCNGSVISIDLVTKAYRDIAPSSPAGYFAGQPALGGIPWSVIYLLNYANGVNNSALISIDASKVKFTTTLNRSYSPSKLIFGSRYTFFHDQDTQAIFAFHATSGSLLWQRTPVVLPSSHQAVVTTLHVDSVIVACGCFIHRLTMEEGRDLGSYTLGAVNDTLTYFSAGLTEPSNTAMYLMTMGGSLWRFDIANWIISWGPAKVASMEKGFLTLGPMPHYQNGHLFAIIRSVSETGSKIFRYADIRMLTGEVLKTFNGISPNSADNIVFAWDSLDFGGALLIGSDRLLAVIADTSSTSFASIVSEDSEFVIADNVIYFVTQELAIRAMYLNQTTKWKQTQLVATRSNDADLRIVTTTRYVVVKYVMPNAVDNAIAVLHLSNGSVLANFNFTDFNSNCTSMTAIIRDVLVDQSDTYFSAGTSCLYRLSPTFLDGDSKPRLVAYPQSSGKTFSSVPTVSGANIYVLDDSGHIQGFDKNQLESPFWTSQTAYVDAERTSLVFLQGGLYKIADSRVSALHFIGSEADLFEHRWSHDLDGFSGSAPWDFNGKVYASSNRGTVFCFVPGWKDEGTHYTLLWSAATAGTTDLGIPAISSDGVFFFATGIGVFAMTYEGNSLWGNTNVTSCSDPYVFQGVGYALCGFKLRMFDLYTGSLWMSTDDETSILTYQGLQADVFYTTPTSLSRASLGVAKLYDASLLPPALPTTSTITTERTPTTRPTGPTGTETTKETSSSSTQGTAAPPPGHSVPTGLYIFLICLNLIIAVGVIVGAIVILRGRSRRMADYDGEKEVNFNQELLALRPPRYVAEEPELDV